MTGRRYITILIGAAIVSSWVLALDAARAQSVRLPGGGVEVEVKIKIASGDEAGARQKALDEAKEKAVRDFIDSRVPPGVKKDKIERIKEIASSSESYVTSWETVLEETGEGVLTLRARIELDENKLLSAMRSAAVYPVRSIPKVFIVVAGTMNGSAMDSAWNQGGFQAGDMNPCEEAMAREMARYGFEIVSPRRGAPGANVAAIMNPQGEEERTRVFETVSGLYGGEAVIIGQAVTSRLGEEGADKETGEATLRVAVADSTKKRLIWSGKYEEQFLARTPVSDLEGMEKVCSMAGSEAAEKLFVAWTPTFKPGEERMIELTVTGLGSYSRMTTLKDRLAESPGVEKVRIGMVGGEEMVFNLTAKAGAESVVDWLAEIDLEGSRLRVEKWDETSIFASVKPAGP